MDFEVAALGMYHLSSLRLAFERSERLDSFNSALVTYEFGLPNSQQFQARRKSGLTRLFNLTIFSSSAASASVFATAAGPVAFFVLVAVSSFLCQGLEWYLS
jgi:hypothetical protein